MQVVIDEYEKTFEESLGNVQTSLPRYLTKEGRITHIYQTNNCDYCNCIDFVFTVTNHRWAMHLNGKKIRIKIVDKKITYAVIEKSFGPTVTNLEGYYD